MCDMFVDKAINFIVKYKDCDDNRIITLKYGLSSFYKSITKLLVSLISCILLGVYKEFFLLLFFYIFIKKYAFGIHAKTSIQCWIITLFVYVAGPLMIKRLVIRYLFKILIWAYSFISFVLWAPADTPARPLIREKQRKAQKIKTCLISLIYLVIILLLRDGIVVNACLLSLVIQAIIINPLLYWITNTPFNNYKYYNLRKE